MSISPGGDRHAAKIFGFDTPEEAQTKQFETLNPGLLAARSTLLSKATALTDRPYTAYTGERVAGLSGNESQALDMAAKGSAGARENYGKATNLIDNVSGQAWDQKTIDQYMNPYTKNVVDQTLKRENTAYQQGQNQLRGQAAAQGAFGGDRATLLEAAGRGKHLQAVGDITAQGYASAYNDAFSKWQADNDRKMSAARAYENVGGDINRMDSAQIEDLLKTGGADRVLRQLVDDNKYNAFIEQRDWNVTNLQPLMQALSAYGGTNPGQPSQQSNAAADTLGAISAIVGYFGKNSQTNSSGYNANSTGYSTTGGVNGGGVYYGAGGGMDYNPDMGSGAYPA